jgi:hypothetical protein
MLLESSLRVFSTGTGGLVRRYLIFQFPRPATLQAAYFAADMPAGKLAEFKYFIILFLRRPYPPVILKKYYFLLLYYFPADLINLRQLGRPVN